MEQRRKRIGAYPLSRAGAAELEGTIFALRALGYINEHDELTLRGRLLRSIFHPAGIMIVELILGGAFDELTASEIAEVCSWFTYDNDRRLNNHNVLNNHLMYVRRDLWRISQHVHSIEQQANIGASPSIIPDFHGVALSWSRGMSLSGLLKLIDLAEGDLLMLLNQTIDLLQQVQSAVGQALDARDIWINESDTNEEHSTAHKKQSRRRTIQMQTYHERLDRLRPLLAQASSSLLRGIIIQSRTVPSMVAYVAGEELPLDAEEDTDPQDVIESI